MGTMPSTTELERRTWRSRIGDGIPDLAAVAGLPFEAADQGHV